MSGSPFFVTFTQQLFNMLNYIFRFCEKKMPHQIIEYSSNLETKIDIDGLVAALQTVRQNSNRYHSRGCGPGPFWAAPKFRVPDRIQTMPTSRLFENR
ncbi:MAG: hypothetical protein Ct9H300mP8_07900 [Gammaproteobacteria bacterium]|nr:MAG: hypothetical protein Ct9H300mP8_07900 [Gammaproteobacteria bacterium]